MRATSARSQLALRWAVGNDLRWDELSPAIQAEVRELLRRLLVAAASEGCVEAGHDE
jgi:hypothetical protein